LWLILFGAASNIFWQDDLLSELEDAFPEALFDSEQTPEFKLVDAIDRRLVFLALFRMMNISLTEQAEHDLFEYLRTGDAENEFMFVVGDVKQLGVRLRTLPVVYFCEAMETFQRVTTTMNKSTQLRILRRAEDAFVNTCNAIPFCPIVWIQVTHTHTHSLSLSLSCSS
jgi:hypothetical protein